MSHTKGQLVAIWSDNKTQWAKYDTAEIQKLQGCYPQIAGHWVYIYKEKGARRIFLGPEGRIAPAQGAITLAYDPRKQKYVYARYDGPKQEQAQATTGNYLMTTGHYVSFYKHHKLKQFLVKSIYSA
ncbi:hypothetical protein MVEN_02546100 [Mycena venus]|uniref:Uncharacterized protein n=1 Tax=Mycena venus TaxID=2733690 RepID=A0A8H6TZX4_9AGAR|nr:hypothetical protein MVEN_02546100 [Mycena venus]